MWSDNDIDNAFQRLNPPEPEPTPFPLDAWLRLENQLDKAVIERAVRRRLWQFFMAEVAVVLVIGLGWLLLWPVAPTPATTAPALVGRPAAQSAASTPVAGHLAKETIHPVASTSMKKSPIAPTSPALSPAPEPAASPTDSRTLHSSSAASPTASSTGAAAAVAPPAPPIAKAHPLAVTPAAALTERSRASRTNAEASARQQSAANGFVTATQPRKSARLSRELLAAAGQYKATTAPDGSVAKTYSETSKHPKSNASRRHTAAARASYPVAMEAHNPLTAHSRSSRTANDTATPAATGAPADAASTSPRSTDANEATIVAAGFAPLGLRPAVVPAAKAVPLPMPLATVALAETPPQPEMPKPARAPRFYVALVGAPDVSTVKFTSIEKPMANVGVVLEYRLTSRLRVNTGLLRANKQYTARREDYDFGANTARVYQRDFTDVEGSCTVFDVPLNLRYDLVVRPQYRVFGSAGLSSFLMQHEEYSYEYPNPATGGPSYWTGAATNQNRHYFSILNVSAGYERDLSSRWSLLAEPYLKLPLAGVGTGKIRLTSAGVFLGVKYGF